LSSLFETSIILKTKKVQTEHNNNKNNTGRLDWDINMATQTTHTLLNKQPIGLEYQHDRTTPLDDDRKPKHYHNSHP